MGYVLVLLTGDTSCHIQGLHSTVYYLVGIQYGKVSCMIIVNGDSQRVRDIEERFFPGHSDGAFWLLKSLEIHKIIMRDQEFSLEVSHEYTSAFQY